MKQIEKIIRRIAFFSLSVLLIQSCTKTEYEQLKRPYNDIHSFSIAGYSELDSIRASIVDNNIIIYWNEDIEHPNKIRPTITLPKGASISPESGVEVDFSENVTYTVTAEDGTVREYKLKPVFNTIIPKLVVSTEPQRYYFEQSITIEGEYFLVSNDVSNIKLYAQRVSDGFEYELPIIEEETTNNRVVTKLPKLTAEMDTGRHRIYVKVGELPSNYIEGNFAHVAYGAMLGSRSTTLVGKGINQPIELGETITFEVEIAEGLEEIAERYLWSRENMQQISFSYQGRYPNQQPIVIPRDKLNELVTFTKPNKLHIKMDPQFFTPYIGHEIIGVNLQYLRLFEGIGQNISETINLSVSDLPEYSGVMITQPGVPYIPPISLAFMQTGQDLISGQELTIKYTFRDEATRAIYEDKYYSVQVRGTNETGVIGSLGLGPVIHDKENQEIRFSFRVHPVNPNIIYHPNTILRNIMVTFRTSTIDAHKPVIIFSDDNTRLNFQ